MLLEKRVLITGGGGFLGSHLRERLLADGKNIVCIDNFTGSPSFSMPAERLMAIGKRMLKPLVRSKNNPTRHFILKIISCS
jgi:UDP-glucose 4-epimerase